MSDTVCSRPVLLLLLWETRGAHSHGRHRGRRAAARAQRRRAPRVGGRCHAALRLHPAAGAPLGASAADSVRVRGRRAQRARHMQAYAVGLAPLGEGGHRAAPDATLEEEEEYSMEEEEGETVGKGKAESGRNAPALPSSTSVRPKPILVIPPTVAASPPLQASITPPPPRSAPGRAPAEFPSPDAKRPQLTYHGLLRRSKTLPNVVAAATTATPPHPPPPPFRPPFR